MVGLSLGMVLGGMAFGWVEAQAHRFPEFLKGLEAWRVVFYAVALPGPVIALLMMAIRADHGRSVSAARVPATEAGALGPYLKCHWRTLTVQRWGQRFGDTLAMHTGQYLAAIALLPAVLIAWAPSARLALGAVFVLGALAVAFSAVLPGLWQGIAPAPLRARVIAISGAAMALSAALGPLAVGWLSDLFWSTHPRGLLDAVSSISAPLMLLSAVLMRWVRGQLQVTLQAVRLQEQEPAVKSF